MQENKNIDILNRDSFVDKIFEIIENLSNKKQSCTFAIDGEWGSGKSFVLNILEEKLTNWQNEETTFEKYAVFHYNCWKYDYYSEPLQAIVSSMYDWVKSRNGVLVNNVKYLLLYILVAFGLTTIENVKGILKKITGVDYKELDAQIKEKIHEINEKGRFEDDQNSMQDAIEFSRDALTNISQEHTIIIVVDELDRCLPKYAIKVLERLHHLFDNIPNLIVILAVDKKHLNNTVSQIFGIDNGNERKDIDSYLSKFIDFTIQLDYGRINENFTEKYSEYLSCFYKSDNSFDYTEFVSSLLADFDSRTRDKIFKKAEFIHNLYFAEKEDISVMCAELYYLVIEKWNNQSNTIDLNIFLPRNIKNHVPYFYDYFINDFKNNIHVDVRTEVFDKNKYLYFDKKYIRSKECVIFYIIKHPRYTINYDFDDIVYYKNKKIDLKAVLENNSKKLKDFYDMSILLK